MKQIKLLMLLVCTVFLGSVSGQDFNIDYVATYTWNGSSSNEWTDPANWTKTVTPQQGGLVLPDYPNVTSATVGGDAIATHLHNVVIPSNLSTYPTLTGAGLPSVITISDLTLESGSTLNLFGNSLTINGFINGPGLLIGGRTRTFGVTQPEVTASLAIDRRNKISFYPNQQEMLTKFNGATLFENFETLDPGIQAPNQGPDVVLNPGVIGGYRLIGRVLNGEAIPNLSDLLYIIDPSDPLNKSLTTDEETDIIELAFTGGSPVYAFSAYLSLTDVDFLPITVGQFVNYNDLPERVDANDGLITVVTAEGTYNYNFDGAGEEVGFVTNSPILSVSVESELVLANTQTAGWSTIDNIRIGTRNKTGGLSFSTSSPNGINQNQLLNLTYNLAPVADAIDDVTLLNPLEVVGAVIPQSGTLRTSTLLAPSIPNLILKSTDQRTAEIRSHNTTANIVGKTTVERNIPRIDYATSVEVDRNKGWRFFGLPYSSITQVGNILSGINYSFQYPTLMEFIESRNTNGKYGASNSNANRNDGYSEYTAPGQPILPLEGIAAWIYDEANGSSAVSGTLSGVSQKLISSGDLYEDGTSVVKNLSYVTAGGRQPADIGWNLVSNPFASTINWNSVTSLNVEGTIYRWNPRTANWSTWNGTIGTGGSSTIDQADGRIESGSSFFVKANGLLPTLTFPQTAKVQGVSSRLNQFGKNDSKLDISQVAANQKATPTDISALRVIVSGPGHQSPADALISLDMQDATPGFDSKYDAYFRGRSAGAAVAINEKSTKMVMQFDRPIAENGKEKRYYPLTVTVPSVGKAKLDINVEGTWNSLNKVYLIDKKEGKTIQLSGNKLSYEFNMTTKEESERFMLAINHVNVADKSGITTTDVRVMNNPVRSNVIDAIIAHPTAKAKNYSIVNGSGATLNSGSIQDNNSVQHQLGFGKSNANGVMYLKVNFENGDSKTVKFIKL